MIISVCMATYNGSRYIQEQLESILHQLGANDEVIISDDYSSDNTLEIVERFQDERIKVYLNQKGKGYTKNFENALEHAKGDVIFLSDQDDVWIDDKVEICLKELQDVDFVVSDNSIVDASLEVLSASHFNVYGTKRGFFRNLLVPRYVGACMAFRRCVLEKSLPFPDNARLCAHDYWISLIAEMYFTCKVLPLPLILYRRHGFNASSGGEKSKNSLSHKLLVRAYTLIQLLKRYFK